MFNRAEDWNRNCYTDISVPHLHRQKKKTIEIKEFPAEEWVYGLA